MRAIPNPDAPLQVLSGSRGATPHPLIPRIDSQTLLQGSHLLVIEHAGHSYYLRLTRNNKLILTK